jgi:hypothetical protein
MTVNARCSTSARGALRTSGTIHVNKVHHVKIITRIAEDLGEDEDWLRDVANGMEFEDGVIWVHGIGESGVQAFTHLGIGNLIELVRIYEENPIWLKPGNQNNPINLLPEIRNGACPIADVSHRGLTTNQFACFAAASIT